MMKYKGETINYKRIFENLRISQAVSRKDTVNLADQFVQKTPVESIANQTVPITDQIDYLLNECGTVKSKILSATICLCDMKNFNEINKI